jgi:hypothetical protein
MTAAIRPNTASAVSMEGNQAVYGVAKERDAIIDVRLSSNSSKLSSDKQAEATSSDAKVNIGPAFSVNISAEGKALAENSDATRDDADTKTQSSTTDAKQKQQQEWRIQADVARFQQVERNVRSHEAAHMSAGGAFTGGVSYVYSKGPDGRMYISGGEVPIQAPEGKTPEETVRNMEIVRRAALAPPDPSGQDLAVAAAAMQIESRARAAIQQGRFLKHSDMGNGPDEADIPNQLPVMPTSMAGLIATLMPQQGILGYGHSVGTD